MSENTINPNNESNEAARKKFVEQMTDLSNPDTRSLIRTLFADFCKSKAAEAVKPAPAPDGMQDELRTAVDAVLRKHNIRDAECSIAIKYNTSEPKPAPEPEPMTTREPEPEAASNEAATSATTSAAEDKRSRRDVALDNIIAWSDRQLTRVPCDGINCDDGCPLCIEIADRLICLKSAITINIEKLKKERNSHA